MYTHLEVAQDGVYTQWPAQDRAYTLWDIGADRVYTLSEQGASLDPHPCCRDPDADGDYPFPGPFIVAVVRLTACAIGDALEPDPFDVVPDERPPPAVVGLLLLLDQGEELPLAGKHGAIAPLV